VKGHAKDNSVPQEQDPFSEFLELVIKNARIDASRLCVADHLMLDKVSGRVTYAVMSFGGFLGLGHSHYPIPWGALKYDTKLDGYVTGITEKQLKDAPAFSDDSWADRNWETQTYKHYNVTPYWA
jgi:hypothetical protein